MGLPTRLRDRGSARLIASVAGAAVLVAIGAVIALKGPPGVEEKPKAPFLQKPATLVTDYRKSETVAEFSAGVIKKTFVKALKSRDAKAASAAMVEGFRGRFPRPEEGVVVPDDPVRIRKYAAQGDGTLDRDAFLKVIADHVAGWTQIERTTWRTFSFLLDPGEKWAVAKVHFQLAGPRPDGTRADLQANVEVKLVQEGGEGVWKLAEFGFVDGFLIEATSPPFRDITDVTGFHFNESAENRGLSQALIDDRQLVTMGGLTVADFNEDGFPDILACRVSRAAELFLNDGKGGFDRGVTPIPDGREVGRHCLYLDLDNDGVAEVVSSQVLRYEKDRAWAGLYVKREGKWRLLPDALEFPIQPGVRDINFEAIEAADVDGNGYIDLFFCAYSDQASLKERHNRITSFDGADNVLFMNQGGLKFTEESDARGITGTQYTYVAKFFDFDGDGDLDLYEGNDYGPDPLWENVGGGKFRHATEHLFSQGSSYSMGITIGDYDNTGDWSVYISNMYSHAGNRILPLAEGMGDELKKLALVLAQGNQLFEYDRAAKAWRETGIEKGVNWADWAWACLFWDFDNDTDKDIFVANGYTSHRDKDAPDY